MSEQYNVLSPWAEVDVIPLRGISPRLADLNDKTIGLFVNHKRAAPLILSVVERALQERYPRVQFSRFTFPWNNEIVGTPYEADLVEWLKKVDAVVTAVGD